MGLFSPNSSLLSIANDLISFMNLLVSVLAPLALVVFFFGLVKYIYHGADSTAHKEARESITWSLIALFVLFSLWGILQLMNQAFFPGAATSQNSTLSGSTNQTSQSGASNGTPVY